MRIAVFMITTPAILAVMAFFMAAISNAVYCGSMFITNENIVFSTLFSVFGTTIVYAIVLITWMKATRKKARL